MYLKSFLIFLSLALLSVTLHAEPILNIDQPIKKLQLTNAQLQSAITSAAEAEKWTIMITGENVMSATYHKSDYMAKVIIRFAPTFYTINYADSQRMRYNGKSIHPTYNKLVRTLQNHIVTNLKSRSYPSAVAQNKDVPMKITQTDIETPENIHDKLANVKKFFDEGLITQEEYDVKRKSLIEAY